MQVLLLTMSVIGILILGGCGGGSGQMQVSCPTGQHDGGDGKCVATGLCSSGYHDGGSGECLPNLACATGYHDGGDGVCVATGTCSSGYHDGGGGKCAATGTCSAGYRPASDGTCVKAATCPAGSHDNGAGVCVADVSCPSGYHDGGTGTCVPTGSCSSGYHDGGGGDCTIAGTCSANYHDGGTGTCVPLVACVTGYHDGGNGICVRDDRCATGYHDGGDGRCVSLDECSPGYHDGGDGTCIAASGCLPGFRDDGAGKCVCDPYLTGWTVAECACAAGYHDDGSGNCIMGACPSGYHDGGDGNCAPTGSCASGYYDDGAGLCLPSLPACSGAGCTPTPVACASGYHDGGDGSCWPVGKCAPMSFDDGSGHCVYLACGTTTGCPSGSHDGGDGTCYATSSCSPGYYLNRVGGAQLCCTGATIMTEIVVNTAPTRQLDLVVMLDNSPAMAVKVAKLRAAFPKLLDALKRPADGTLPDLRVAMIDSDLGTGGAYSSGSCALKTLSGGTESIFGDLGRFQMLDSPAACAFDAGAEFLEYKGGAPLNYTGDISTVFGCLAENLGTMGCAEEHQLQAFELALVARGVGNEQQQADFLRANAMLGLLFLTDEDDCSTAPNDGMFGDKSELRGETASLRCATRGHECAGRNLTASPPGYPTDAPSTHAFSECYARNDTCPNQTDGYGTNTDTSGPTDCAPLKNVQHLAEEIKSLKSMPEEQIMVAGIFGWPLTDADMSSAVYKIAPIPNPNTADTQHPQVHDYWPICYDPDHKPAAATTDGATGFDAQAASWGATGGLRESAFIEQFGLNGMKFSACERDYTLAMTNFGTGLATQMQNLCVTDQLYDADKNSGNGVQADCRVVYALPQDDANDPTKITYVKSTTALPRCDASYSASNPPPDSAGDCWQLANDATACKSGLLVSVLRTAANQKAGPLTPGTKLDMICRTCHDSTVAGCGY
jgi:hypothetical protein